MFSTCLKKSQNKVVSGGANPLYGHSYNFKEYKGLGDDKKICKNLLKNLDAGSITYYA